MGPKKNDDKVAEQIHRNDDRIVAVESKLSAVEERLNEMMKFIASGFERIELRKEDQTEGRDRRGEGLIPSGLNSNPAGASKPMVLQGERLGETDPRRTEKHLRSEVYGGVRTRSGFCQHPTLIPEYLGGQGRMVTEENGDPDV